MKNLGLITTRITINKMNLTPMKILIVHFFLEEKQKKLINRVDSLNINPVKIAFILFNLLEFYKDFRLKIDLNLNY